MRLNIGAGKRGRKIALSLVGWLCYEAAHQSAGVAQLVEHVIRNDGVVGSSPITGTI